MWVQVYVVWFDSTYGTSNLPPKYPWILAAGDGKQQGVLSQRKNLEGVREASNPRGNDMEMMNVEMGTKRKRKELTDWWIKID